MDGDGLSHRPSIPLNLTGIGVVQTSLGFHLNFDWLNCEWQLLNKKKTTHVLALKGNAGIARLWFIGMTKFALN